MTEFNYYLAQVVDGVAYGSIYSLFALSVVLLYRTNKLMNFAQAEMATFFAVIAVLLLERLPYLMVVPLILILSFGVGSLLHLGIMRVVTERRQVLHSNESLITIGLFTIFNSFSAFIHGDDPKPFPSPFGSGSLSIGSLSVSYNSLGILATSSLLILGIFLFFRFSRIGTIAEAVAENIVAARIRGIRASNVIALAWGLTTAISAIGAMMIAPVLYVTPDMLSSIFPYSLIAIVIGGLESPLGAIVGGIVVGVVENLASNTKAIGAELKFLAVIVVMVIILSIRPRGLWGRLEARRV